MSALGAGPRSHIAELTRALRGFDEQAARAESWGTRLAARLERGSKLLVAGNGGSAAEAQHLSAELLGRFRDDRRPLAAIALHCDTSTVTAVGNDYGFEQVFARQVTALARPRDVLILMSTSGASPNLLAAARAGRCAGAAVWALTGPAPNPLAEAADDVLAVDARTTATVQELHLVVVHLVAAALDAALGVGSFADEQTGLVSV